MQILKNEQIDREKWNKLLAVSEFSSPFQTPEFYDFYNTTQGLSADVFAVEVNSALVCLAVITLQKESGLKSWFSRRGIIYGGPLILPNDNDGLDFLLKVIEKTYHSKLIYLEVRNNYSYDIFKSVYQTNQWAYSEHLNVKLNLINRTVDNVLALMTYNRRRELKISLKEGAMVQESENTKEIREAYAILKNLYEIRVKLPLPSEDYFQKIGTSPIGKVFIIKHENKVIGSSFCFTDDRNSINTLYYSGLRNYHKKIFPTHLAILGVIKYAALNNIKTVDFMGAGKPGIPYGVRDYKLEFGGDLVEHGRFIKVLNPFLFQLGKIGLKLLSKIK